METNSTADAEILITGGSGLIGSALTRALCDRGHRVIILSRRPHQVDHRFGELVTVVGSVDQIADSRPVDAVVNLAGAQIVGKRWTNNRKHVLRESRIDLTRQLIDFMARRTLPPRVLVSGSAVGYYGDCGDTPVEELTEPGDDFGARLCVAWEQEALRAEQPATRVCLIRTGLVLSASGGMLEQMLLPFRLALGARLGNGEQWMSWIHIDDEVAAIIHLLESQEASGAFNLAAPQPVTNRSFTTSLASALKRPALFMIPDALIRVGLGESALLLLGGQKAVPQRLLDSGFEFQYPALDPALSHLLR